MHHTPSWTRRQVLARLSLGSLLALGLWPGCARWRGRSTGGAFRFIVVNDTHYMSPECGPWLDQVVARMKTHPQVEFCLLAGDLTENGGGHDLGAVREIFAGLGRPVHVVIGNHDYDSATSRAHYEKLFPGRLNYAFEHRGWQFVGLDTSEGTQWQNTRVQPPTLQWLDDHLPKLIPARPTVVFTHFPLGEEVRYRPLNAEEVLARFLDFNLQAVYCGHFHGTTVRSLGSAVITTNQCCALKRSNHDGTKEKGYFLCTAEGGRVSREFVPVGGG